MPAPQKHSALGCRHPFYTSMAVSEKLVFIVWKVYAQECQMSYGKWTISIALFESTDYTEPFTTLVTFTNSHTMNVH